MRSTLVPLLVRLILSGVALLAGGFPGAMPLLAQAGSSPPAPGQPRIAEEVPEPDNPEVAFMFLLHHRGLMTEVRKLAASRSSEAIDTERAAAASMNVGVTDFRGIRAVYAQVAALLQSVDRDADAYRDHVISAGVPADVTILRQFNQRKTDVKVTIKRRLQAVLSAGGYAALNSYIEGSFRETIHIRRAQ